MFFRDGKPNFHRNSIIALHRRKRNRHVQFLKILEVSTRPLNKTIKRFKELGTNADRADGGKRFVVIQFNIKKCERLSRNPEQSFRLTSRQMGISEPRS